MSDPALRPLLALRDALVSGGWRPRVEFVIVVGAIVGVLVHQSVWWDWAIEDAAISYAYARNLVEGHGLVPFVGGERLEGYSNPTWVLVLAGAYYRGFDLFEASRWMEAILLAVTVPLTWAMVREGVRDTRSWAPAMATVLLAVNPTFALWGQSGLENALWGALMATFSWRLLYEERTGEPPWSALGFLAIAWTRPEGILQAAVAGGLVLVSAWRGMRSWRRPVAWATAFWLPWIVLEAARLAYFAWPFPQTYYAKLEEKDKGWFDWDKAGGGWLYVRNWAHTTGWGYAAPLVALGATTTDGQRPAAVAGVSAIFGLLVASQAQHHLVLPFALLLLWAVATSVLRDRETGHGRSVVALGVVGLVVVGAGEWARRTGTATPFFASPALLADVPVYVGFALLALLPLAAIDDRPDSQGRLLWTVQLALGIAWAVLSVGDWMKGYRWFSLTAVPLAALAAVGFERFGHFVGQLMGRAQGQRGVSGWIATALALGCTMPAGFLHGAELGLVPDTSPASVKARVDYVQGIRHRLHAEGPWVDFDVDMGAHMWWSDFRLVDMAGLIDVPLAQHRFARAFIEEYLFKELKPHFFHVHGNWAKQSGIPTYPEFTRSYVEIPGYPQGKTIHGGNFIRKDLVLKAAWPYPEERRVPFEQQVALEGWRVVSPEVGVGRMFHLELGLSNGVRRTGSDFRVIGFLHDGTHVISSFDLAPGYDWLAPHTWGPRDRFHGHYDLPIPPDTPLGRYGLGFVVLRADGTVLPPMSVTPDPDDSDPGQNQLPPGVVVGGRDGVPALFANGEIRWAEGVEVISIERLSSEARDDRERAYELAHEDRCEDAEAAWYASRMHRPQNTEWVAEHLPKVRSQLSECWARRAVKEPSRAIEHLRRALDWQPEGALALATARPLADQLVVQGEQAQASGDWDTAYARYRSSLEIWPWNAWARRYAEEARTHRLGLDPDSRAKQREETRRQREEARKARAAKASGSGSHGSSNAAPPPEDLDVEPDPGGDDAP